MQDKDGGYCPKCDTVWASPGKCRCEMNKEYDKIFAAPDAKIGKFNTEPKEYPKEITDVIDAAYKEIWNAAIEAAAKDVEARASNQPDDFYVTDCNEHAEQIRKLKK